MSTRACGMNEYGVVVDDAMMRMIAKKMYEDDCVGDCGCPADFEREISEDPLFYYDVVEERLGLLSCGCFTGEVFPLLPNGMPYWKENSAYCGDQIYIMQLRYFPSLYRAAYSCFDDIIREIIKSFKGYLPNDFDFSDKISVITGVYYG